MQSAAGEADAVALIEAYEQDVRSNLRRNFWLHVSDGALYFFGMSFISPQTVFPVFIRTLGASNLLVACIPVVFTLGMALPQVFIAGHIERLVRKKPTVVFIGFFMRLPWLIMAVVSFALPATGNTVLLWLAMGSLAFIALSAGLVAPAWFSMVSATVPVHLRGRLFSLRTISSYLLGMVSGITVRIVLKRLSFPYSYGTLFACSSVCVMLSLLTISLIKEPAEPIRAPRVKTRDYLRRLPSILRSNRGFFHYIVSKAFLMLGMSVAPFFAVYALSKFKLSESYAGDFTVLMTGGFVVAAIPLGYLADKLGHKVNFVLAGAFLVFACLIALFAPGIHSYYVVFVLAATALSVRYVSMGTMAVEFCSAAERPTYIALGNALMAPVALLTLGMGWIGDTLGYTWLFSCCAVLSVVGCLYTLVLLRDPRRTSAAKPTG